MLTKAAKSCPGAYSAILLEHLTQTSRRIQKSVQSYIFVHESALIISVMRELLYANVTVIALLCSLCVQTC